MYLLVALARALKAIVLEVAHAARVCRRMERMVVLHQFYIFGLMNIHVRPCTVSSRGDTFRVHSVARGRAELLFTLSRGYTGAIINDLSFDYESSWLGVSTGRGTTRKCCRRKYHILVW
jgi:hypothetical protein